MGGGDKCCYKCFRLHRKETETKKVVKESDKTENRMKEKVKRVYNSWVQRDDELESNRSEREREEIGTEIKSKERT